MSEYLFLVCVLVYRLKPLMNNTMTNGLGIVAKSGDHQGHPTSLYGASWRIPALCILCQTTSRCWEFWLDKPHGK